MSDEEEVSTEEEENEEITRRRVEEERRRKHEEIERKKKEVRKRLEEASAAKKGKKGFMTPERKKKLRLLLRKAAAEELKKEQERKAVERRRIIAERCGNPKNLDAATESDLREFCKHIHQRITALESSKYDLQGQVKEKDQEIDEMNKIILRDHPGKFPKPHLNPTRSKYQVYDDKITKLQRKAAEFNFRSQLKQVGKKREFSLEEEDKKKPEKPEWAKKQPSTKSRSGK